MPLRPSQAILFPYTTLFRSLACQNDQETCSTNVQMDVEHHFRVLDKHGKGEPSPFVRRTSSLDQPCKFSRLSGRDRKSTRLNSSHGYISYAVFCLNKKKERR